MALGFGIIGCGMIADFHARAIAETRGAKLLACQSRTWESAKKFARKHSITPMRTLAELLAHPGIDAVTICTPSGVHMEPAVAAANAGKHVIVEKPLEVSLKRCDRVIDACDKAGVTLSTIFPSRFHRSSQTLKNAIDKGRFGRLTLGDAYVKWFRTQEYYDSGQWRGTRKLDGGGALMNQAIHSVDLLAWLMGDVVELSATTATLAHERIEVEDVATASLKFANGALGVIVATTAAYPGWLKKIEIHGSHGSAAIEEESIQKWQFKKMTSADRRILDELANLDNNGGGASDPASIGHAAHTQQFRDFVKAIRRGTPPLIDGREGRKSVEIILAIYQSAQSGKRVRLPLKRDPILRKS